MGVNIPSALRVAVSLYLLPAQCSKIKKAPLPSDIDILLLIAGGNEEELRKAADMIGRSKETTQKAVIFFIENILLAQGANSYRILGVNPNATNNEIRRNMALMTRYLHPDLNKDDKSDLMARVTGAWSDLKTAEKRATYDGNRRRKMRSPVKTQAKRNTHKGYSTASLRKKTGFSGKQRPLSKRRRLRGAFFRQITLFLAKFSGR